MVNLDNVCVKMDIITMENLKIAKNVNIHVKNVKIRAKNALVVLEICKQIIEILINNVIALKIIII